MIETNTLATDAADGLLAMSVAAYVAGDPRALSRAVETLGEPDAVARLIGAVLSDDAWLAHVLARSYWHPNGFVKLVLAAGASFQLRMHVWRPTGAGTPVRENVHSHRWDFCSVILHGRYRYQEFERSDDGDPFRSYIYDGHSGISSYRLTSVEKATLRCVLDAELAAGTHYTLTSDALHRVIADPERVTASLVLQGPHRRGVPVHVFADAELRTGGTVPLRSLSRTDLLTELRDLRDMCGRVA